MTKEIREIVSAAIRDGGIKDDHNYGKRFISFGKTLTGIGMIKLGEDWHAFPMFDNERCYPINGMYLDRDGHAHVSMASIAGAILPWKDNNHGFDFYNQEILDNQYKGFLLNSTTKEFKVAYLVTD